MGPLLHLLQPCKEGKCGKKIWNSTSLPAYKAPCLPPSASTNTQCNTMDKSLHPQRTVHARARTATLLSSGCTVTACKACHFSSLNMYRSAGTSGRLTLGTGSTHCIHKIYNCWGATLLYICDDTLLPRSAAAATFIHRVKSGADSRYDTGLLCKSTAINAIQKEPASGCGSLTAPTSKSKCPVWGPCVFVACWCKGMQVRHNATSIKLTSGETLYTSHSRQTRYACADGSACLVSWLSP